MTSIRSPQNGLFPTNLQTDLIGNSSCQLICSFQGVQNLTSARSWHCRLCQRSLVTTMTRTQHPQFTQVMCSQILIGKMTYVMWTQIPFLSSLILVFCFILKAVFDKIPPTEITTKWIGNHAKTQYAGFYQIIHRKLSWRGRGGVVVCWIQRGSSQGVENKGRNQHKKSSIFCKKIGSLPCILFFSFFPPLCKKK